MRGGSPDRSNLALVVNKVAFMPMPVPEEVIKGNYKLVGIMPNNGQGLTQRNVGNTNISVIIAHSFISCSVFGSKSLKIYLPKTQS